MILDCIRHGVTEGNVAGRFNGVMDDPLTAAQIAAFAGLHFDATPYDAVFVSPSRRCQQTASGLGLTAWGDDPRLAERHLGCFQGLTPEACRELHGDAFAAFSAFDEHFVIPEGESRAEHLARVMSWLAEVRDLGHRRVLAITHGGVIDFLYRLATGTPAHGGDKIFAGGNLARSSFRIEEAEIQLIVFDQSI